MDLEGGFNSTSYFLQQIEGHQSFVGPEREAVSSITQNLTREEIDEFRNSVSPGQLADLRIHTRNLTTSCVNENDFDAVNHQAGVLAERNLQSELRAKIIEILKSIPNSLIRECLVLSLRIVAENYGAILGAAYSVIKKIGGILASILTAKGEALLGTCALVGAALTGSLAALGLTVVGIGIVALLIYKKRAAEANNAQ